VRVTVDSSATRKRRKAGAEQAAAPESLGPWSHRSTLGVQGRLRRALRNPFAHGFFFGTLGIGLDAPKWRSRNHVSRCKSQRDGRMGEKFGADDRVATEENRLCHRIFLWRL
jgi:hypothetical protein